MYTSTKTLVVILFVLLAASCGGGDAAPGEDSTQDSTGNDSVTADTEVTFDITKRDHVGIRLALLLEIMMAGNPLNNPIGWAQAGAAAIRVREICDNFEAPEVIDDSCDLLLTAIGTPFNQSASILADAQIALREIVSRRTVAAASWASKWDDDITDFRFNDDFAAEMRGLRALMVETKSRCVRSDVLAFWAALRAYLSDENVPEVERMIGSRATSDLEDYVLEYGFGGQTAFGCSREAERIADEINKIDSIFDLAE